MEITLSSFHVLEEKMKGKGERNLQGGERRV